MKILLRPYYIFTEEMRKKYKTHLNQLEFHEMVKSLKQGDTEFETHLDKVVMKWENKNLKLKEYRALIAYMDKPMEKKL